MENLSVAVISAIYGDTPDENSDDYQVYLLAVSEESKYLSSLENVSDVKKITLGDFSEEYFDVSSSQSVLSKTAKILLDSIYDIRRVGVF